MFSCACIYACPQTIIINNIKKTLNVWWRSDIIWQVDVNPKILHENLSYGNVFNFHFSPFWFGQSFWRGLISFWRGREIISWHSAGGAKVVISLRLSSEGGGGNQPPQIFWALWQFFRINTRQSCRQFMRYLLEFATFNIWFSICICEARLIESFF